MEIYLKSREFYNHSTSKKIIDCQVKRTPQFECDFICGCQLSLNCYYFLLTNRYLSYNNKMPVVESGEKAFPYSGLKPGLEIWRIEVC